jgi:hypothetical protein
MRVNVFTEEMTDRIEIVVREVEGTKLVGLRFHDGSSGMTLWGRMDLRDLLKQAIVMLDEFHAAQAPKTA